MIRRYLAYLRRSITTLPGDIVSPYHKIIDLILKLVGLWFAIIGSYKLIFLSRCYISISNGLDMNLACTGFVEQNIFFPAIIGIEYLSQQFLFYWLEAAGYLLIALFISSVLIVRHLNETLPDHIYLRCFATDEERRKRILIKD